MSRAATKRGRHNLRTTVALNVERKARCIRADADVAVTSDAEQYAVIEIIECKR